MEGEVEDHAWEGAKAREESADGDGGVEMRAGDAAEGEGEDGEDHEVEEAADQGPDEGGVVKGAELGRWLRGDGFWGEVGPQCDVDEHESACVESVSVRLSE